MGAQWTCEYFWHFLCENKKKKEKNKRIAAMCNVNNWRFFFYVPTGGAARADNNKLYISNLARMHFFFVCCAKTKTKTKTKTGTKTKTKTKTKKKKLN